MIIKTKIDPRIKIKDHDDIIEPVIIRLSKFSEEGSKEFSEDLSKAHNTGQSVIPIVVDSYGGQVYSLLGMISEIQSSELPIATICETKAMSCGAILFCMGTEGYRFMGPHATMMLHEVSTFMFGKVKEIKADSKETERLNEYIFRLIAGNLGKEPDYFLNKMHDESHADWYLTADDAKNLGIANHVRLPKFTTEVSVNMRFE